MNNLRYSFKVIFAILKLLARRLVGKSKYAEWDLKTELVWTSTRTTLLASNQLGLPWLKKLSAKFKPKSSLEAAVDLNTIETKVGKYLSIRPKALKPSSDKVILYFHGGGYVTGSPDSIIEFSTRLAITSQAEVIAPYYPTAPEQIYPAAHQFAHSFVADRLSAFGAAEIYLAGDSAGAALVLSAMLQLTASQNAQIKGCILISPWVEPLAEGGSIDINEANDVGDHTFLLACYHTYMAGQKPLEEYPLSFGLSELRPLPPSLVTIGSGELLLDQTNRLVEHLQSLGTETQLLTYQRMFHTFWNLAPTIEEADILIGDIAQWMAQK